MRRMTIRTGGQMFTLGDFGSLKVKHPYIAVLPQARFLEFIVDEAKKYPDFTVLMGARAEELVERDGVVRGVRYKTSEGPAEILAHLTVAADGRGSRLAKLAGFEPVKKSPPMDVYWFTVPRLPEDDDERMLGFRVADGKMLVLFERYDAWQVGYVMLKGHAHELQAAGIESFHRQLRKLLPEFGDRVEQFKDWRQAHYLAVESSRVPTWYKPGFLLIGDSAHVMSPVGGVGINYAIQDAVATANLLGEPLKSRTVDVNDLAQVQARREWPVKFIQGFQTLMQNRLLVKAIDPGKPFKLPLTLRIFRGLPLLRSALPRIIGYGVRPESIR
jgi:2-polyprenyl-6-methoxyphenol hydroxylase-like FAD-dependent oxidoreductase